MMRYRSALWASALLLSACALTAAERREEARKTSKIKVSHRVHMQGGVHCTRCHKDTEKDHGETLHLPENSLCINCHEETHAKDAYKDQKDCMGCHQEEEIVPALLQLKKDIIFDHAKHSKLVKQDCVRCHRGAIYQEEGRTGAIPLMSDCGQCHAQWIDDLKCDGCHRSLEAYPLLPVTEQAHRGDFLRRHAAAARQDPDRCGQCHDQASCADCHSARAPFAASVGAPDRPDRGFVHRPNYLERHAWEARMDGPSCLGCHSQRVCNDCHTQAGRGPGGLSPHGIGWASTGPGANLHGLEARRDILSCVACHGGAGGALCAECHAPGRPGGTPHARGREPQGDKLRDRPCTTCHSS